MLKLNEEIPRNPIKLTTSCLHGLFSTYLSSTYFPIGGDKHSMSRSYRRNIRGLFISNPRFIGWETSEREGLIIREKDVLVRYIQDSTQFTKSILEGKGTSL
ncbi:hypothetical protein OCU04_003223 [Sclerotinia nivalis]|uniref:Uncharacterized protein n=1 Tax=Sclerotinia nivalis TaxID=352851 RepID=A0A9X0ASF0_9HELO|nr:hypothetical protein OCU04_003223 [Sclerotinia nivalis]